VSFGDAVRSVEVSPRAAELVRRIRPTGMPNASVPTRVRITVPASIGQAIRVMGDFNHWQPEGMPLAALPGLDPALVGIDVPASGPVRYRLLVDGRLGLDTRNPRVVPGPDGRPANELVPHHGPARSSAATSV
jgi:hypothetical protein